MDITVETVQESRKTAVADFLIGEVIDEELRRISSEALTEVREETMEELE